MRQSEILEKIVSLEERINAFGDVGTKVAEIDGYVTRAKNDAEETAKSRSDIATVKQEVDVEGKAIADVATLASSYSADIEQQKKSNSEIRASLQKLIGDVELLKKEAQDQLGSISAQVLSNAFDEVAKKLEKTVIFWAGAVAVSTILLFASALGVVYWELNTGGTISVANVNFLLKATLTSPFIFLLGFSVRQFSKEKNLYDNYTFKSAVALSFEAFRKLIKEESDANDHQQVVNFIISTVSSLYTTPIDNTLKNEKLEDIEENLEKLSTLPIELSSTK